VFHQAKKRTRQLPTAMENAKLAREGKPERTLKIARK
jgi:hypothetical protein